MRPSLRLRGLSKSFGADLAPVLHGIDLTVTAGEVLAVVGGSGCGKSTLLRLIAGLEIPSAGQVLVGDEPVQGPHPSVGLVFQEPRLLPWLTVAQNIEFGLQDLPRAIRQRRVGDALERIGLSERAGAWPHHLSGGQAQRVALARALVTRPQVLLLDEPFSALDALTRADLQDHLIDLWSSDRPTLILVTHDIEEALVLADRVAVMRPRPGSIADIQTIDLPRPRDRDHPAFEAAKRRLRASLNDALSSSPARERRLAS